MDCYELSQKDICCSPISFFAEKPEKKNNHPTQTPLVFPIYMNLFLSPLSSPCVLGFSLPLAVLQEIHLSSPHAGDVQVGGEEPRALSKTTLRQALDGRRLARDLSFPAPPSCEQPHLFKQKGKTAPQSRYALLEMPKQEEAIGCF